MNKKVKTSVALDPGLLQWIDEMVMLKRFANTSHAVEYALQRLKENEKEELHILVGIENLSNNAKIH
jgi:Arc/MetJ-type ribon-helix-helix transcriptional regulator